MKKILNYSNFFENKKNKETNSVNEGLFSWLKDKVINSLTGWSKRFLEAVKKGKIPTIPSGPDAGKPIAMLFVPENGSILEQLRKYKSRTNSNESNTHEDLNYEIFEAAPPSMNPVPLSGKDFGVGADVNRDELLREITRYYKMKVNQDAIISYNRDLKKKAEDEGVPVNKDELKPQISRGKPIFIFGAPGIGKSEIIAQFCDENELSILYMDLQYYSPEDFKGIPSKFYYKEPLGERDPLSDMLIRKSKPIGRTIDLLPEIFPTDSGTNGKGGIIFMDEANRANEIVLSSLLQFINPPHRIGNYFLPDNWIIVMAGNRRADTIKTAGQQTIKPLSPEFANRAKFVNYVPELEHTAQYWKGKGSVNMPIEMVNFLEDMKLTGKDLFHKNILGLHSKEKEANPFPSPRSWQALGSELLGIAEVEGLNDWKDIPEEQIRKNAQGYVGDEATGLFLQYLRLIKKFTRQDMQDVINNPMSAKMIGGSDATANDGKVDFGMLIGLIRMIISLVPQYNTQKLYNILKYVQRYGQFMLTGSTFRLICSKFKDSDGKEIFDARNYEFVDIDDENDPDFQLKKKALEEISADLDKYKKNVRN